MNPLMPDRVIPLHEMHTKSEMLKTLEDLVRQFAYPTTVDGSPALTTGGLSALEGAFTVLGWDDPHVEATHA